MKTGRRRSAGVHPRPQVSKNISRAWKIFWKHTSSPAEVEQTLISYCGDRGSLSPSAEGYSHQSRFFAWGYSWWRYEGRKGPFIGGGSNRNIEGIGLRVGRARRRANQERWGMRSPRDDPKAERGSRSRNDDKRK